MVGRSQHSSNCWGCWKLSRGLDPNAVPEVSRFGSGCCWRGGGGVLAARQQQMSAGCVTSQIWAQFVRHEWKFVDRIAALSRRVGVRYCRQDVEPIWTQDALPESQRECGVACQGCLFVVILLETNNCMIRPTSHLIVELIDVHFTISRR